MMTATPILWTAQEAAQATGGWVSSDWMASGVSIDSRTLNKGDLFVALHGPNFDGHDFVSDALSGGAAAAVVDRELKTDGNLLKVGDTMVALEALGRASRQRSEAQVVAVTGSVGKTGSKEALKHILSRQGKTSASKGSLNNHWGVPLSLSRMAPQTVFGVFELGMNHPGEIKPLSKMVRPHVALITTVEAVHSEFFNSEEEIADAKAEIFAGLEPGGAVVLNRDNRHFDRLAAAAKAKGIERIIGFGASDDADFRLLEAAPDIDGSVIRADLGGALHTYRLSLPGDHWVINSLGVLAVVAAVGAHIVDATFALSELEAPKGRGRLHTVLLAGGSLSVIDESYNASPISMAAAIKVLGQIPPENSGRRIAVLGDMLELGADAPARHAALAHVLQTENIDLVFAAGPNMAHLFNALPAALQGGHAPDSKALEPMVVNAVGPGDVVVVKGSAGSRTARIVDALRALGPASEAQSQRVVNGD